MVAVKHYIFMNGRVFIVSQGSKISYYFLKKLYDLTKQATDCGKKADSKYMAGEQGFEP